MYILCVSLSGWAYNSALCGFSGFDLLPRHQKSESLFHLPPIPRQFVQFCKLGNRTPNRAAPTGDSFLSPDQIPSIQRKAENNKLMVILLFIYMSHSYKTSALWQELVHRLKNNSKCSLQFFCINKWNGDMWLFQKSLFRFFEVLYGFNFSKKLLIINNIWFGKT